MYAFIRCLPVRYVFLFLSFILGGQLFSQNPQGLRHCKTAEYQMDLEILLLKKKIRYNDSLTYHWFKSQKVHQTQGRSSGDLLHGTFSKFYLNGQLAEQGEFKYGLKEGEWFTWYKNGKIKTLFNYKSGRLHGKFVCFNEDGKTVDNGVFKKDIKRIKKVKEVPEKEEEIEEEKEPWLEQFFKKEKSERLKEREEKKEKRKEIREDKKSKKEDQD